MARRPIDDKPRILRQHGCLNARPGDVRDELFLANAFFDPRDLLQVKYEMLPASARTASRSAPPPRASASRARRSTRRSGPTRRAGCRRWCPPAPGRGARTSSAPRWSRRCAPRRNGAAARFPRTGGTGARTVRSLGPPPQRRARPGAAKKTPVNGARRHDGPSSPGRFATSYERLRGRAVRAGAVRDREALAVLAQRGIAAWLDVLATLPVPAVAATPRHAEPLPTDVETRAVDILLTMVRPHMAGRTA